MILEGIIGSVIGLLGGFANGWVEIKKHRAETERLEKQFAHDEAMFAKQADAKREDNADQAFLASISSVGTNDPFALPAGSPWWLLVPLVLVETLRRGTRPVLTWALCYSATQDPRMMGLAGTAVGWWFGTRTSAYFQTK